MTDTPDLPGRRSLKNWRDDRIVGYDECCYAEHAIYLALGRYQKAGRDYPRAIVNAVEHDLIIWSDLNRSPIYPVAKRPARGRIQFPLAAVCLWLAAGGGAWIRAALGAKSAEIITFPTRGGDEEA